MQHALSARAASFGAASVIMGAAVFAALSISFTVMKPDAVEGEVVVSVPWVEPPPPTPEPVRETNPRPNDPVVINTNTPFVSPDLIETAPQEFTELLVGAPNLGPMEITRPQWLRRPENVARFYPARAIERGVEGEVRLDCIVAVRGLLNCSVAYETPTGWGFGAAALRIAGEYRMSPALRDGVPVEGRYRMVVPFNLD